MTHLLEYLIESVSSGKRKSDAHTNVITGMDTIDLAKAVENANIQLIALRDYVYEVVSTGKHSVGKYVGKYVELRPTDGILTWIDMFKYTGFTIENYRWYDDPKPGILGYVLNGDGSMQLKFELDGDWFDAHFMKNGKPGTIYTCEAGKGRWIRCFVDFVNNKLKSHFVKYYTSH